MSNPTPPELERFDQFVAEKLATGEEGISPEEALDEFRTRNLLKSCSDTRKVNEATHLQEKQNTEHFLEELHQRGVLEEPKPIPAEAETDERPLVEILGPPLSQTIIEDRR